MNLLKNVTGLILTPFGSVSVASSKRGVHERSKERTRITDSPLQERTEP